MVRFDGSAGSAGGEMGERMRAVDWSRSAVGPVETWPRSLATAARIMLTSRYAMWMAWGPELTFFYNDAYRPTLGNKEARALGASAREVWAEIWGDIAPRIETVMRTGEATWDERLLLFLERNGYTEETYHTFSYSPLPDDEGGVGGMLCVVTEDTERAIGERRLALLHELASGFATTHTEEEVFAALAQKVGAEARDLPFSLLYLFDAGLTEARLVSATGAVAGTPIAPKRIDPRHGDGPWPARAILSRAEPRAIVEVGSRLEAPAMGPWDRPPRQAAVIPIAHQGQDRPAGFLVAGINPYRPFDAAYRGFIDLLGGQIAAGLANARAHEEELRRVAALAEIDRSKTAFFSNVSHEFRTPLTLILGPVEDAAATPERALAGEDLATVRRNALRLLKLVNALLDFSRIEAGRLQASYQPTDLASLTADLASAFRAAIERAGLAFEVDCPPLPGPVFVDRDMWEKIVLNLLSNALKFTFAGSIRVVLRDRGDRVELAVRDTGAGIPEGELPRLFERFHRIHGARSRTHEGSGIGLALVHELSRLHGGGVQAASQLGEGTTFTVAIPLGSAHLPQDRLRAGVAPESSATAAAPYVEEALRWSPGGEAPAGDRRPAAAPSGGEGSGLDPMFRILLADDNADMRDYVGRILGERWTVEAVEDGAAALAAARRSPPDLVITDVMMPNLDGFGLLRELRAGEPTRGVPVLMLSARSGEESRVEGLEAGADDYLVKPFSARELRARVATHLQLGALRRQAKALLVREQEARRDAESANRAKEDFLAMLGHELRNPLAPITTALALMRLRHGGVAEKERGVIERQVEHLTRLVDDLLDVARVTGGKIELRKRRIELAEIVSKGVETASPSLERRRQHLSVQVPQRGLAVHGDPVRLAQVVSNLLTNAAKYSESGGFIAVDARRDGASVVLRVRDDGIGIDPRELRNIFDMFAQERQALDRSQGGLGLGLAIVRSLVALHGGSVAAHSEGRGLGSEFTIRLPAVAPEGDREAAAPPARRGEDHGAPGGHRILVVDDNRDAAALLADILGELGHATRVAHDGPGALQIVEDFVPDIALLDLGLPVMDGYELARRLREQPSLEHVHLAAVTGYGQSEDRLRTREAGFDAHFVKPIQLDQLRTWLADLVACSPAG